MSCFSRGSEYLRSERGGDWFQSFLKSYAKLSSTTEILDAINNKRGETIEGVVKKYRELVGLDALAKFEDDSEDESVATKTKCAGDVVPLHFKLPEEAKRVLRSLPGSSSVKDMYGEGLFRISDFTVEWTFRLVDKELSYPAEQDEPDLYDSPLATKLVPVNTYFFTMIAYKDGMYRPLRIVRFETKSYPKVMAKIRDTFESREGLLKKIRSVEEESDDFFDADVDFKGPLEKIRGDEEEGARLAEVLDFKKKSSREAKAEMKRYLSIRHASEDMQDKPDSAITQMIKSDSGVANDIDSYLKHSGGTKKIFSIIRYLRERLGPEVSFTDESLIDYIESRRKIFKGTEGSKSDFFDPGAVGLEADSDDDDKAEYFKNNGNAK